jgi:hypothetical protein
MISLDQVKVYASFNGDMDNYSRAGKQIDGPCVSSKEWQEIYELLAGMSLCIRGVASAGFASEIESRLVSKTVDEATRNLLRRLAEQGGF